MLKLIAKSMNFPSKITTYRVHLYICHNNVMMFHCIVPPRITQGPVNTTVSEGDSTSLTCQATGDPPPMVLFLIITHHISYIL